MANYASPLREYLQGRVGYFTASGSGFSGGRISWRTPPVPDLNPAFADVVILLHMDGSNGGTTFTNSAARGSTFTVGGCQTSTGNVKYGTASLLTNGVNQSLIGLTHADYAFGTNPFLMEFWVMPASLALDFNSVRVYFDPRPAGLTAGVYPQLFSDTADGQLKYSTNGVTNITSSVGALTAGVWQHVAVCRAAGNTRLFVNGIQQGVTFADSQTYVQLTPNIGAAANSGGAANGNYDDFRMANGSTAGVYTTNFTPPAQAFPNS